MHMLFICNSDFCRKHLSDAARDFANKFNSQLTILCILFQIIGTHISILLSPNAVHLETYSAILLLVFFNNGRLCQLGGSSIIIVSQAVVHVRICN